MVELCPGRNFSPFGGDIFRGRQAGSRKGEAVRSAVEQIRVEFSAVYWVQRRGVHCCVLSCVIYAKEHKIRQC